MFISPILSRNLFKFGQGRVYRSLSSAVQAASTGKSPSPSRATGTDIVSPLIGLTEQQITIYELASQFAKNEMEPFASKWDEESHLSMETLKKCAELGFGGMFVSEDVGGSGLTRLDTSIIVEALAQGCVGHTAMLTIHNMCAGMIDKFGTSEQRKRFLPKMCTLENMASYCLTEPGSGSDAAGMATTAVLNPANKNEYIINGGKAFISGAGTSELYVVMCKTGPKAISCFVIPKDTPGLSFGANEKKMGWKVQPTRQVIFEDCKVPVENRLGNEGQGFAMAMAGLDGGRINIGSCSLGASQFALEKALAYTKERKQFGQKIADFQTTQFKLAQMANQLWLSRLALRQAAALLDEGHPAASAQCAMAKKTATEYGSWICNEALQLHGGYGYLQDYHMERLVRDLRVHQILEGTSEVMSHIVGKALVN